MIDYDHIALVTDAGSLVLNVHRPSQKDSFIYKQIDGLGPPQIDLHTHDTVDPGNIILGTHAQGREIVITVGLNPWAKHGGSFTELRSELYSLLTGSAGSQVQFAFMKQGRPYPEAWTSGVVSNIETIINGPDPEAQITMKCESPYFELSGLNVYTIGDFSVRENFTLGTFDYRIDLDQSKYAPTGVDITMRLKNDADLFEVFTNSSQDGWMRVERAPLKAGAVAVQLTTTPGSRRVIQGAQSLLHYLGNQSDWIMLSSRPNTLTVRCGSELSSLQLITRKYLWGI